MSEEGDRWFHIEQERKRDQAVRVRRAQKRAKRREQKLWDDRKQTEAYPSAAMLRQRHQAVAAAQDKITMMVTEWEVDEHGNLSRRIYRAAVTEWELDEHGNLSRRAAVEKNGT